MLRLPLYALAVLVALLSSIPVIYGTLIVLYGVWEFGLLLLALGLPYRLSPWP